MAEVKEDTLVDGRYWITARIGSGGMADVYCADDTHLGREVALKVLHRRFSQDEEFVERFRREASAAAGLQHPNVVGVYDRGSHDDTWYIAMERLRGPTLKQIIREEAPLDQVRAIDLTVQVLTAAGFAHKRGVVHRDFKPHNVIVGQGDAAKVTDFGIARAGASEMTETGSIMGTAQYLSPEQAQGQRVDARSDLYSIGIILFELLTGTLPFSGESAVSIALKHVSEPAPSVASLRPGVHPVLEAIVARALVKDPSGRFQTAEEFVLALDDARRAILSGEPVGDGTTAFVPVGPPPPPVGAAVNGDDPYGEEDPEKRERRKWPFIALALIALGLIAFFVLRGLLAPDQVRVPRVAGLDVDRATQRLERQGFDVKVTERRNDRPPGIVLGSDPRRGEEADEGSTVTLIVSEGPGEVDVPDVVGFTQRRAQKALAKVGFKYQVREQPSTTVEAGRVIRTSPSAGRRAEYGERVILIVSSGPEQVSVPGVVGLTESSARAALEGRGLLVSVQQVESGEPEGEVLRQSPGAGARVSEGSTVTITVSEGRNLVAVPGVVGQSAASARGELAAAGFTVQTVTRTVTSRGQDGQVLSQSPSGGSERARGSSVTIVVGSYKKPKEEKKPDDGSNVPDPPPPDEQPGTEDPTGGAPTPQPRRRV